jgi:phospholipase C
MLEQIQHIVVLMLENRSFDHMLGSFQQIYPLDGINPAAPPRTNPDIQNNPVPQAPGAERVLANDPKHETRPDVLFWQLRDVNNSGFVMDYTVNYPDSTDSDQQQVMLYHDLDTLPALHALARNFTICDHWFSSVPGPTWTNRLFAMSGTSQGRVIMPSGIMDLNLHWYDQITVFDRLNEKGISWKVYYGDFPLSLVLVNQRTSENRARHRLMTEFFADAAGDPANFPAFSWIEPSYLNPGANDDHPPHDVLAGEPLIANVYNQLRRNEALWNSTLLVVLFDEHGGFYDHVSPPPAVPPDLYTEEYSFDRLGLRVPCILASPWFAAGVLPTQFDHTSLLKFMTERWNLGTLGARTAAANCFSAAILNQPRDGASMPLVIPSLPAVPPPPARPQPTTILNDHELAILALSHLLEGSGSEDATVIATRSRQLLTGGQTQRDVAVDRLDAFLKAAV